MLESARAIAFVPATDPPVVVSGDTTVFQAGTAA